ncbi:MAG: DsbA family protein [Thermoplasmatota archaeon]
MPAKVGRKTKEAGPVPIWVWALVALVVIGGVVAGLVYLGQHEPPYNPSEVNVPMVGNRSAKVHIYLFEDYQCPICKQYETGGASDHLFSTWVTTGKVLAVIKPVNILDDRSTVPNGGSTNGAYASFCVWHLTGGNSTLWHDWHHEAYVQQGAEGTPWATPDFYRSLTQSWSNSEGHISMTDYDSCVAGTLSGFSPATVLTQDMTDWNGIGATGTPTLYVKGQPLGNPGDTAGSDSLISAALK